MRQKNDMVFPVSLSEIAFTLVFILMLLLGFLILGERDEREKAQARAATLESTLASTQSADAAAAAMSQARNSLAAKLAETGTVTPEQVSEMVQAFVNIGPEKARQEQLQQEVLDLTKKLVALEELRARVQQAGRVVDEKLTREEVEQALAMQTELAKLVQPPPSAAPESSPAASGATSATTSGRDTTKPTQPKPLDRRQAIERVREALAATKELREQAKAQLGVDVASGQEAKFARDVVAGARRAAEAVADKSSPAALRQENATLRTQVAFYDKRDKLRGLDHPPCWMDSESKIEFIFNVQTTQEGFVVTRGWPSHREAQARASAGFDDLMGGGGEALSTGRFSQGAKPFLDHGKAQSPECRHFVYLSSSIVDADRRDNARRLVNSVFYVLERKSPMVP